MASELTRAPDEAAAFRQIGRELRDARLARGEDLRAVAAFLRIRPDHLAALENGDMAGTPGRVYALGFLRSYGNHLELDGDLLVARLKASLLAAAPHQPSTRRVHGSYATALVVLMLAVASFAVYRGAAPRLPGPSPAPAPAAVVMPEPAAADPIDVASAAAAEPVALAILAARDREDSILASAPPPGSRISLLGRADGWIQLRSGDRSFVRSGTLAAGQRLVLPPRPDLLLSASDGGSVELLVDGVSMGAVGPAGVALRDLPLPGDLPPSARRAAR